MNLSKSARAIRFSETGGPEVLKIENVEIPAPGPHEVRVSVKAIGVNRVDSWFRQGLYFEQPVFPSKIGFEAAGIIDAIGEEVKDFKVGDKVNVVPAFSNHDYGTYGELILVPAYSVQRYPDNINFEQAASLWTSFLAVYGMLADVAKLQKGQFVVINAASSSTGLAAIQLVNALGGISIALTTSVSKKQALSDAGAKHVIVTSEQDLATEVLNVTSGKGASVILDAVGGSQFEKLIASAAEKANVIVYGALNWEPAVWPGMLVLGKMLTVTGYNMADLLMNSEKLSEGINFINQGVTEGKLAPVIAKVFSLEEVTNAHSYLESNQQFGKIVLSI